MPYLNEQWQDSKTSKSFGKGEWVPEMDLKDWIGRHSNLPLSSAWVGSEGLTPDVLTNLQLLPPDLKRSYLETLGADIGSAQRDGFLYANFFEQLKQAVPASTSSDEINKANEAADGVVNRMSTMGMTSVSWSPSQGGPPAPASFRPWRKVMEWLMELLNKVGRFLLKTIETFWAITRNLFHDIRSQLKGISFEATFPPGLSFEFSPEYFTDYNNWTILRPFIEKILEHMGKLPSEEQ